MKLAAITFAAALAVSGSAFAASPFVGKWKMDAAKSTFTGDTMTFAKTASGYHQIRGAMTIDFTDDGRPYPTMSSDATVAWTRTADGGWDLAFVTKGKTLSKGHRTISTDGRTLTTTYEEYRPDGTTVHETAVFTRVGAGSGLEGTWKSTRFDAAADSVVISHAGATAFTVEYPTMKSAFTTKLDGSAVPVTGPANPAGESEVIRKVDDAKWTYTDRVGDKVVNQGVMTVSADGSTLTDASWAPGKEDEKSVGVYDRQ